jgi:hypothetical protein
MKRILALLMLAAISPVAFADAWNDSDIFVEAVYRQSVPNVSTLDATTPVALRASVRNTFSDQTQSLVLPVASSFPVNPVSSFQRIGAHHVFWQGAGSYAALSQEFSSGIYSWMISGSNSGGTVSPALTSSPFTSAGFQPQIVNGSWNNGRLRLLASDPRFQIAAWTGAPVGARIEFELWRSGGAGGSSMGASTTTVSWLPQPAGSIFSAYLSFRVPDAQTQVTTPSGGLFNSRFGRASTLYFEIEMVSSLSPPEEVPTVAISSAIKLSWMSQTTKTYQVQYSSNLQAWQNTGAVLQGTGQTMTFFDSTVTGNQFYRVLVTAGVASGLNVIETSYGANSTYRDVRSYVVSKIVNDTVNMQVSNSTLGGDPAPGTVKYLYIKYQNQSGTYEANLREGTTLRIPDATHTKLQ